MQTSNLAKWIDELQSAIETLKKKIDKAYKATDGLPTFDISNPEDGQMLIYDGSDSTWKNHGIEPGGYNETVLYSGTATAASYALSDSVENYDLIYISATYRNNSNQDLVVTQVYPATILTAAVDTDQVFSVTSDYYYSNFEMTDAQTITKISESYLYINKVIGIKF